MRGKANIVLPLTAVVLVGMATSPAAAAPPIGCGSVVTKNVVLQADLTDCTGDGLVVGAPGIRIDLNGHRITTPAVDSSSIPVTPGTAGIRNRAIRGCGSRTPNGADGSPASRPACC